MRKDPIIIKKNIPTADAIEGPRESDFIPSTVSYITIATASLRMLSPKIKA